MSQFNQAQKQAMKAPHLSLDMRSLITGGALVALALVVLFLLCLLYTSPSPRDGLLSRMPSSA